MRKSPILAFFFCSFFQSLAQDKLVTLTEGPEFSLTSFYSITNFVFKPGGKTTDAVLFTEEYGFYYADLHVFNNKNEHVKEIELARILKKKEYTYAGVYSFSGKVLFFCTKNDKVKRKKTLCYAFLDIENETLGEIVELSPTAIEDNKKPVFLLSDDKTKMHVRINASKEKGANYSFVTFSIKKDFSVTETHTKIDAPKNLNLIRVNEEFEQTDKVFYMLYSKSLTNIYDDLTFVVKDEKSGSQETYVLSEEMTISSVKSFVQNDQLVVYYTVINKKDQKKVILKKLVIDTKGKLVSSKDIQNVVLDRSFYEFFSDEETGYKFILDDVFVDSKGITHCFIENRGTKDFLRGFFYGDIVYLRLDQTEQVISHEISRRYHILGGYQEEVGYARVDANDKHMLFFPYFNLFSDQNNAVKDDVDMITKSDAIQSVILIDPNGKIKEQEIKSYTFKERNHDYREKPEFGPDFKKTGFLDGDVYYVICYGYDKPYLASYKLHF